MDSDHAKGNNRLGTVTNYNLFVPNEHFSDRTNSNIIQSEIEGGVWLAKLPIGSRLEIETSNRIYDLLCADGDLMLSGHPEYCPQPVPVSISGSTWGGSMLKEGFIGRGMHMEFRHPDYHQPITTSQIRNIRVVK